MAKKQNIKAVGLLSGGLDSTIAAKIIAEMDVEIYGLHFLLPWSCGGGKQVMEIAKQLSVPCTVIELGEHYLEMIKEPKYGYGTAVNPCVDCHIYMLQQARQFMKDLGADFVFTGEVIGQRPMSQLRQSLALVERKSGLEGRLLRPLCAQLLEPTIPEKEGLIDRNKLLAISGRSRKQQQALAAQFGITDYVPTGGGCLLTDKNFERRIKDMFEYGYRDFHETASLRWGRHFRISNKFKVILGRDKRENDLLCQHAHPHDYVAELAENIGPTAIIKGDRPDEETLSVAGGLLQKYSKHKNKKPLDIIYWQVENNEKISRIESIPLGEKRIEDMRI